MMMDSEEEEEQTALVCDNGKFTQEILLVLPLQTYFKFPGLSRLYKTGDRISRILSALGSSGYTKYEGFVRKIEIRWMLVHRIFPVAQKLICIRFRRPSSENRTNLIFRLKKYLRSHLSYKSRVLLC